MSISTLIFIFNNSSIWSFWLLNFDIQQGAPGVHPHRGPGKKLLMGKNREKRSSNINTGVATPGYSEEPRR